MQPRPWNVVSPGAEPPAGGETNRITGTIAATDTRHAGTLWRFIPPTSLEPPPNPEGVSSHNTVSLIRRLFRIAFGKGEANLVLPQGCDGPGQIWTGDLPVISRALQPG